MKKTMFSVMLWGCILLCFPIASRSQEKNDPIRLAVLEALSGPFQYAGEYYLDGVMYAVEQINEQGGLAGRPVEVIPVDSQLNPEVAIQEAKRLIEQENVKYLLAGTGSHISEALFPLIQEKKVVLFSYAVAADNLTGEQCNRYFFRTAASTAMHSGALAFWVVKNGYKKVFGIAQDYSFGRAAMAAFTKKLQMLDPSVEIVGERYHPLGAQDLTPYIEELKASGAEIVFTPNWGVDLVSLFKQANAAGVKAHFAGYYINDRVFIETVGDDEIVAGSIAAETYMLSIPLEQNTRFVDAYYQAKGDYPVIARGKAYATVMFWAEAIKKAGTADVEAVIDAWEGLIYDGPAGKWYMRPCDHQTQLSIWMAEIVKDNPFYEHAYVGPATAIPVRFIAVPCEETGCPGLAK